MSAHIPGVSEDTLIAVGRVARFVPSPSTDFRGYDLDIQGVLVGGAQGRTLFLHISDPIPGIGRAPVLIVAETHPGSLLLTKGVCQPLRAISEAELARWADSR